MNINWVSFTTTVPESAVPELTRLAAEFSSRALMAASASTGGTQSLNDAARRAYTEIDYPFWRTLLVVLALKSLEADGASVSWSDLVHDTGADAQKLSGTVGAAHKALDGQVPFERRRGGGTSVFHMPLDAAETILNLARENPTEALMRTIRNLTMDAPPPTAKANEAARKILELANQYAQDNPPRPVGG